MTLSNDDNFCFLKVAFYGRLFQADLKVINNFCQSFASVSLKFNLYNNTKHAVVDLQ